MAKYRVDMSIVKKHCSMTPYLNLVRKEVNSGQGFVEIRDEVGENAGIYAAGTSHYFLGLVWVPRSALREA